MKEARITDTSNEVKESNSLINIDDLIMEIGKQHVDKMNSDKVIRLSFKNINELKNSIPVMQEDKNKTEVKLANILESNKLYEVNNKKLDTALVELRKENSKFRNDIIRSNNEIDRIKMDFINSKQENDNTRQKLDISNTINNKHELEMVELIKEIDKLKEKLKKKSKKTPDKIVKKEKIETIKKKK